MELFLVTVGPYMEIFINFWLLFMVKKYVLLERGFEKKKQNIMYWMEHNMCINPGRLFDGKQECQICKILFPN